jgi:tetratricopeptide (TPR) repeat protein
MDRKGTAKGDRILVLIAYLGLLSIGIHMTVFLIMPVIFLLVIWEDKSKFKDFRFWIAGLILSLVMVTLQPFLILLLGWLVVCFVVLWVRPDPRWVLSFSLILVALVGYSVQGYIPVRSNLDPAIDENNPDNWERFKYFLERKQYGQQSMMERMFTRRGELANQFGVHPRMGFWSFFREQYMDKSLWFIPILLGGFGLWSQLKRRRKEGVILLFLILLSTVGLVLYMNFSDGTHYDSHRREIIRLEVRDRDYFFTPGFVFFALSMGLGVSGVMHRLSRFKNWLGYSALAIFLISPVLPITKHFHSANNRSNKHIPYDYAYNLLNSCDKDAIMFTNGDNDTFPLWFAQEVEGIRKDVRVVNLSLLNTDWYILQLKHNMEVPISFTDTEIARLRPYRTADGKVSRVQDLMIDNILDTNRWKYPIYFAATVAQENKIYKGNSIDNHLRMEGMAYRVVSEEGIFMVDVEKMQDKLFNVFRFRGLNDPKVHKNENDRRLVANYGTAFLTLADTLRRAGKHDEAIQIAQKNLEIIPDDWKPFAFLIQLYADKGEHDRAEELLRSAEGVDQERINQVYLSLAAIYQKDGDTQKALDLVHYLLSENPQYRPAFQYLFTYYYQNKNQEQLLQVLRRWVSQNPNDKAAVQALNQISLPDFSFPEVPPRQR